MEWRRVYEPLMLAEELLIIDVFWGRVIQCVAPGKLTIIQWKAIHPWKPGQHKLDWWIMQNIPHTKQKVGKKVWRGYRKQWSVNIIRKYYLYILEFKIINKNVFNKELRLGISLKTEVWEFINVLLWFSMFHHLFSSNKIAICR